MKVWIPQKAKHRKLFILLFSIISFFGFSDKTFAQGWTFTFQLAQSGPCGGGSLVLGISWFVGFGSLDIGIHIGNIISGSGGYTMSPQIKRNR